MNTTLFCTASVGHFLESTCLFHKINTIKYFCTNGSNAQFQPEHFTRKVKGDKQIGLSSILNAVGQLCADCQIKCKFVKGTCSETHKYWTGKLAACL